ncbi:MAG: hypothetical protein KKF80_05560, partial [Candidatus Omnitrophica bacterium]|nr:hypothetical protein [Candidatus Omnitrophota bacterium]
MHKKIITLIFCFCAVFSFIARADDSSSVSRIAISGNKIVSDASIVTKIKMRAGTAYSADIVNEDIKNLYATGFFEFVDVSKEETSDGVVVTFTVKEKPVLKKVTVEGARFIRKNKIEETVALKEGTFVDEFTLQEAVAKVKDLYVKKGYSQATVTYDISTDQAKNESQVKFIIDEKRVVKVLKVTISGNKALSTRKVMSVVKTRKSGIFNWWAAFKDDVVSDDVKRIVDFY